MKSPEAAMGCKRLYGFTLIEILLVIVVLSILASLTIPDLTNSLNKLGLKNKAYKILDLMQSAHLRALSQNSRYRLASSPDLSHFWLEHEETNGYSRVSGSLGKIIDLDPAVKVVCDGLPVEFMPDGSIGKAEITLCILNDCILITTKELYADIRISEWTSE